MMIIYNKQLLHSKLITTINENKQLKNKLYLLEEPIKSKYSRDYLRENYIIEHKKQLKHLKRTISITEDRIAFMKENYKLLFGGLK